MLSRCRPLLGTFVEVTADSEPAIEAAFEAVARVHRLMSAHERDSDVSRINRLAHMHPVHLNAWTTLVLERARFWSRESEGAFDVVRAGKAAIDGKRLPRHPDQPMPVAECTSVLTLDGHDARLAEPACVDLGGIAKGFAVDRALDALRSRGAQFGFVNAGGDMAGFGRPWPVQVVEPRSRAPIAEVILENQALATSALVDGTFDHICGADARWISATVRAATALDADALTKVILAESSIAVHCVDRAGADAFRMSADGVLEPMMSAAQ